MIHLVIGRQGSGKTLFLVRTAWATHLKGADVYSNVHLKFDYKELNYHDIVDCKLTNCMTLLDEVHQLLPARLSMRKINREICDNFLSMARKQNNEVYGTTQTLRKVDIRFREEADYIYFCTKYAYANDCWTEVLHSFPLHPNVPIMVKLEVEETYSGNVIENFFLGNEFYDKFDTNQIVRVKGLDKI